MFPTEIPLDGGGSSEMSDRFRDLRTEDEGERREILDEIFNTLSFDARLFRAVRPQLLQLAYQCPFADVRREISSLLDSVEHSPMNEEHRQMEVGDASAYYAPGAIPKVGTHDEETTELLQEIYVESGRCTHLAQVYALNNEFLRSCWECQKFLFGVEGPILRERRFFLAIMASSCFDCGYLASLLSAQFLDEGGDRSWIREGLRAAPQKLQDLVPLNRILAHQPWTLTPDHIGVLTQGRDSWSLSELVQAMVILVEFHTLSGAVLGFGVNPELDLDPTLLSPAASSPVSARGSANLAVPPSSVSPLPSHDAAQQSEPPPPAAAATIAEAVSLAHALPLSAEEREKTSATLSGRSRLGSHKRFRATDIPPNQTEVDETRRLAAELAKPADEQQPLAGGAGAGGGGGGDHKDRTKVLDLFDSAGFPHNAARYLRFSPRFPDDSHSSNGNSSSSSNGSPSSPINGHSHSHATSSSSSATSPNANTINTANANDPDGSPSLTSSSYRTRARTHPSSSPRAREALVAADELSRDALTGSNTSARSHHDDLEPGIDSLPPFKASPLGAAPTINPPLGGASGSLMHQLGFFYDENYSKYCGTKATAGVVQYVDFDVRSKLHQVFSTTDYNFRDHGHELMERFYPGAGPLYEDQLELAFTFTDNSLSGEQVDTGRFRLAVWRYVHRLFGIIHDDYDYKEVNIILNPSLKKFMKKVTCCPNDIVPADFQHMGFDLRPEEKLHMTLLALHARKEVSLMYGLHAVMKYTMRVT